MGMANQEVAHIWANQGKDSAKSSNGNFSFEGRTLFSYVTPIGHILNNGVVVINTDNYSVTTSGKHMPALHRSLSQFQRENSIECQESVLRSIIQCDQHGCSDLNWKHLAKDFVLSSVKKHIPIDYIEKDLKKLGLKNAIEKDVIKSVPRVKIKYERDAKNKEIESVKSKYYEVLKVARQHKFNTYEYVISCKKINYSGIFYRLEDFYGIFVPDFTKLKKFIQLGDIKWSGRTLKQFAKTRKFFINSKRLESKLNKKVDSNRCFRNTLQHYLKNRKHATVKVTGAELYQINTLVERLPFVKDTQQYKGFRRQVIGQKNTATIQACREIRNTLNSFEPGCSRDDVLDALVHNCSLASGDGYLLKENRLRRLAKGHEKLNQLLDDMLERVNVNNQIAKARRSADEKRKHAEKIQSWLRGEQQYISHLKNVYLRAVNVSWDIENDVYEGTIETSQRASVSFRDAVKLFSIARSCHKQAKAVKFDGLKAPKIGYYTVNKVDARGNVDIGCHHIEYTEITRLANQIGYPSAKSDS